MDIKAGEEMTIEEAKEKGMQKFPANGAVMEPGQGDDILAHTVHSVQL